MAGTFPGPALLIDVKDEGTDSVADVEDLDVMEVTCWEDIEDVYWHLKQNPDKYKTVIIDTVTQLQQLIVSEIHDSKNTDKAAGDWGTMTKQDWGTVASKMKIWITNYRDLPMEVVFIAQDRTFNLDDDENPDSDLNPEVGPALSPSISKHLCAAVSIIGHTFIRNRMVKKKIKGRTREREVKEYCLRLGPSASYITKFRKPKSIELPGFLVDPTYEDILETIKGN